MSIDPSTSGTLDFKQASKITFVGSSSNTVIDTVTGSFGIGVDVNGPSSNLHVVGNTRLEGDINMLHTSNNAAIKLNSNVVTEFPRSKKLIKYPRVTMTGASTPTGYVASASRENGVRQAYTAFDGDDTTFWQIVNSPDRYDTNGNATSDATLFEGDNGEWIKILLPDKVKISSIRRRATGSTRRPTNCKLYGSNDDTTWDLLEDITFSNTDWADGNLNTNNYYNYFVLQVLTVSGNGQNVDMKELELYGIPEYDPDADGMDVKVTSYPNAPNTDWLEVYYDAKNYTSGNNVQDETANNRDGVLYGNTSLNSADGIHKFDFDGSGDYIESLNITSISGNQTMSSSVWVKFTSWTNTTYDFIYSLGDRTVSGNGTEYSLVVNHQTNGLYTGTNGLAGTAATRFIPDLGRWYHFATTYDGDTNRIFIDGTLRNSESLIGDLNLPTSGCDLVLGGDTASSRGQFMNGSIANFRLFNRALTSDEVWQLYAYQKEYFGHGDLSMTLKAGRLGIGTSEPRAVLDVRGDVMSSSPVYFYLGINSGHVASTTKIPFNVIRVNKGGGYDAETYNFTAPIGGWYWMAFGGCNRSSSSVLHMSLKDGPNSSDSTILMAYDRPSGQSLMHANRSGLVYIREGGIVSLWVTSSTVDGGNGFGGASVEWGGFLVSREFQGEN